MKKEAMDYKLWIGFCQYIRNSTGTLTREYASATTLLQELKRCKHDNRPLSSYWVLLAKVLFTQFKISDERIAFKDPLRDVKYTVNGKEYETKISYIINDIKKFPEESRVICNAYGVEEEKFIKQEMKRLIQKYPNCDTEKIFVYQNCINVIVNE